MSANSKIYHSLILDQRIETGIMMLEDGEHDEQGMIDYLNGLEGDMKLMMEDLCSYLDESKSDIQLIKDRKTSVDKRKKSLEKQLEQIRAVLTVLAIKHGTIQKSGAIQVKTVSHTISVSKQIDTLIRLNEELETSLLQRTNLAICKNALMLKDSDNPAVWGEITDEILEDSGLPKAIFNKLEYSVTLTKLDFKTMIEMVGTAQEEGLWDTVILNITRAPDAEIVKLVKIANGTTQSTIFDNPADAIVLTDSEKAVILQLYSLEDTHKISIRG